jgi:hypothetical protein
MDRSRDRYAVYTLKSVKISYNLSLRCIEDHQLIRIHVRDVQPSTRRIEALVIESDRRPWHWNIGDFDQDLFYLPRCLRVRQWKQQERERRHIDSRPYTA